MVKIAEMGSGVPPLPASSERLRQRYDNHLRLVAGEDLVFPKGGWENGETEREAACREAFEEAGIKGIIHEMLGVWEFRSKSSQNSCSLEGTCRGCMFAFEVTEELTTWPEQAIHQRRWVTVKEAFKLCRYDWMREALSRCLAFLSVETASSVLDTAGPSISTNLDPMKSLKVPSMLCVDSSSLC